MEKKDRIIGIAIACLLAMIALVFFLRLNNPSPKTYLENIKGAEIAFEKNGIKNIGNVNSKYLKIYVEYYYDNNYCLNILKSAISKFNGAAILKTAEKSRDINPSILSKLNISENEAELPAALFNGNVIYGISACSEKILTIGFCAALSDSFAFCDNTGIKEESAQSPKSKPSDMLCFDPCLIKYGSNDNIITRLWRGPPCDRIEGYSEGASRIAGRECFAESCKTSKDDLACCKPSECIDAGKCYKQSEIKSIGSNNEKLLCAALGSGVAWANPDINPDLCSQAGFAWIEGEKKSGFCCGDENEEHLTKCQGKVCPGYDDSACCSGNMCVLNGACYKSGCDAIKLNSGGEMKLFCDGRTGSWIDLDENKCQQCLGKSAWSGTICCGDDPKEGPYPVKFALDNKNFTSLNYFGCATGKSDCVYPESDYSYSEGFYNFKLDEKYLHGGYYCSNGKWFGVGSSEEYCKKSGFSWDAEKGSCILRELCGNNVIDNGESCELPDTQENPNCNSPGQKCFENKLGLRFKNGYCNSNCFCEEGNFSYSCVKGSCGAKCANSEDCIASEVCDLNSCQCIQKTHCGDKILQEYNDYGEKEECELPNTLSNSNCKIEECKGKKSALKFNKLSEYGSCNANCRCDYGDITYDCRKGSCGAECSEDGSGCGTNLICNTVNCACQSTAVCGNGICEAGEENSCPLDCRDYSCPSRVSVTTKKNRYSEDDLLILNVSILDKVGKPIPDSKFNLEILVNEIFVGSGRYITASSGAISITKKVTSTFPKGYHKFIVKTNQSGCKIITDSNKVYIDVANPINASYLALNYKKFEFLIEEFNVTNEASLKSSCGNDALDYGEVCEGSNICRNSFGCDYRNRVFDIAERCSSCSCPPDTRSEPNDDYYCAGCSHCGDGKVNCNEECDGGKLNVSTVCRNGNLYRRIDSCVNCRWFDDGIENDVLAEICKCDCPDNPQNNCLNGNYINYTQDYSSGCAAGICNSCNCADTYSKDANSDGIDDKCGKEYCSNGIDDDDDGIVDEKGCISYYCSNCGRGLFNLCERPECKKFEQKCFFTQFSLSSFGSCTACSEIFDCEGYSYDNSTCRQDPCSIGNCIWDGNSCCTDSDRDGICDLMDNCFNAYNPKQEDKDKDGAGDACDLCKNEPALFEPSGIAELNCTDNIDNDCDGHADCNDIDCLGNCTNNSINNNSMNLVKSAEK